MQWGRCQLLLLLALVFSLSCTSASARRLLLGVVSDYKQCGGDGTGSGGCTSTPGASCVDAQWSGFTCGSSGFACTRIDHTWWACKPSSGSPSPAGQTLVENAQCGGTGAACGSTSGASCVDAKWSGFQCAAGFSCNKIDQYFYQCQKSSSPSPSTSSPSPSPSSPSPTPSPGAIRIQSLDASPAAIPSPTNPPAVATSASTVSCSLGPIRLGATGATASLATTPYPISIGANYQLQVPLQGYIVSGKTGGHYKIACVQANVDGYRAYGDGSGNTLEDCNASQMPEAGWDTWQFIPAGTGPAPDFSPLYDIMTPLDPARTGRVVFRGVAAVQYLPNGNGDYDRQYRGDAGAPPGVVLYDPCTGAVLAGPFGQYVDLRGIGLDNLNDNGQSAIWYVQPPQDIALQLPDQSIGSPNRPGFVTGM